MPQPTVQRSIPKAKGIDNTMRLLKTGYPFIPSIMKTLDTDIFQTRLLCKKTICITGTEAAQLFYNPDYFIRQGANPMHVQKTLFGINAIQGMDGDAHAHRRQLFLSILSEDGVDHLNEIYRKKLAQALPIWQWKRQINLFQESATLLCESVCEWCNVPITPKEARYRAHQFVLMIFAIGKVGPTYQKGKAARKRTEAWIESLIEAVRAGKLHAEPDSALRMIADYRDPSGTPLKARAAAIELINVIRPTVAIAIYIVFSALALRDYPQYKEQIRHADSSDPYLEMFAQEVRRFYPVGPFLGARVKKDFTWHEYTFTKGTLVFLDVYGMNKNPELWKYPDAFYPEHMRNLDQNTFMILSQGGGDYQTGHRCPGERLTVTLMKTTIDYLVHSISYTVPEQNLQYSLKRIPTLPASGFNICDIKRKHNSLT